MFSLALLYYLLTSNLYKMNIMNVSYDIIPPKVETCDRGDIEEICMQAAIERFASFDEYMEIPGFGGVSREEKWGNEEEEEDDKTVCYDDETYQFPKCGEIKTVYSNFWESDTLVPEYEDYIIETKMDDEEEEKNEGLRNISEIRFYPDYEEEDEDEDEDEDDSDYRNYLLYGRIQDRMFQRYDY